MIGIYLKKKETKQLVCFEGKMLHVIRTSDYDTRVIAGQPQVGQGFHILLINFNICRFLTVQNLKAEKVQTEI